MRLTGRLGLVAVAIATVAWCRSQSDSTARATSDPVKLASGVVNGIAAIDADGIRWHISAMLNQSGTQSGVSVYNVQTAAADVTDHGGVVWVSTPTWSIALDVTRVTEIVCVSRFIHQPPPGFTLRSISFRKGPDDEDGYPDEMFDVFFDEERERDFEQVCNKHGLRRDDDRDR